MFYIADDIRELLKGVPNRSELVNGLLNEYFKRQTDEFSHLTTQQKKELIKVLEQKEEIDNKAKELLNGNSA